MWLWCIETFLHFLNDHINQNILYTCKLERKLSRNKFRCLKRGVINNLVTPPQQNNESTIFLSAFYFKKLHHICSSMLKQHMVTTPFSMNISKYSSMLKTNNTCWAWENKWQETSTAHHSTNTCYAHLCLPWIPRNPSLWISMPPVSLYFSDVRFTL